jgi:hypothetical protein
MNEPEMRIHAIAADLDLTLEWNNGSINMTVKDTSGLPTRNADGRIEITKTITTIQASAVIALFINELEEDQELNKALYKIAEEAIGDLPQNLRPIP